MYQYGRLQQSQRAAPVIDFLAFSPGDSSLTAQTSALVDTGATITCVPESVISKLGRSNLVATPKWASGAFDQGQQRKHREAYVIDIKLGQCYFRSVEVVVLPPDKGFALIGRDILNGYKITFDAPNGIWIVHADCT